MKTRGLFNMRAHRWRVITALASLALALPVQAGYEYMQIEQVIGGVNGDTTAQAVQLRMRAAAQNLVNGGEIVVFNATGSNPIVLLTFPTSVSNGNTGSRILITSPGFASYESDPIASDFTMTNTIPASYFAAGRIVYRKGGSIVWSLSWGGAGYTGSNLGSNDNDADGDYGPPFAGALPSTSTSALNLNRPAGALSTTNADDYWITPFPAIFTNNAGDYTSLISGPPPPSTLGNISTRLRVETGDNALIGGFIITGTQPKKIIVRAIGPALPFAGVLADPILELRDSSGGLLGSNDNWRTGGQETEIIATTIPPGNELESAIVATLPANNSSYTAIVRGVSNGTGIGVVEAYDLDRTVDSKLGNISTRGLVQTDDNVLIGGLIVLGQDPLRIIVRAIGPSLPLPGALGDPTLNLHDNNGTIIASNNDWRDDPGQETEIIATGVPPSNNLESAIVRNVAPGNYTAIVRGMNNTTGVAVVEAYGLN